MSKVKITGSASGTSTFTLTTPTGTSTDRTITLPDSTGTVLMTDGDGSNLSNVGVDGIVSSANATAITIDSSERVGIGTTSPDTLVHIKSSVGAKLKVEETGGSYGELEAGGSGLHINAKTGGYITFRPNGGTEAMRINSSGTLLLGVTSSSGFWGSVLKDPNGISLYRANSTGGNAAFLVYSDEGGAGTNKGYWKCNGGIVNYQANDSNLSDERVKKDIADAPSSWDVIKGLRVRNFKYKTDEDSYKTHTGLIAQETASVDSSLVNTTSGLYGQEEEQENTVKESNGTVIATSVEETDWIQGKTDGIYPSDSTWTENERFKTIYNTDLYFKMLKTLQEAQTKIETLEAKVTALEAN